MTDVASSPQAPPHVHAHGVTKDLESRSAVDARHMVLIDAMINWSIANPGKNWTECARAINMGALWVRTVASTDAFRARWAQVRNDLLQEVGIATLRDKVSAAAEMAIERLAEKIPVCESMGELSDTAEMLLNATYGKGGSNQPAGPQHVTVQTSIILEGRRRIIEGSPASETPSPVEVPSA